MGREKCVGSLRESGEDKNRWFNELGHEMPRQNTPLAIIYDFDGTLAPGNMQEPHFIPDIKMTPKDFWNEVNQLCKIHKADKILMYMHLMLKKAQENGVRVHLQDFQEHGQKVTFFKGVEEWFDRIDAYATSKEVFVEHYIVSSGNAEIIEGTPIAEKCETIYASRFMFDHNDVPVWPAQAVNYTTKTQFLFRINKRTHELTDDTQINRFVAMKDRPIPFENMIYIGDGMTDIPCFRLVKELGGFSIAVYKPNTKYAREEAEGFLRDERVHCVVPADYRDEKELDKIVKAQINLVSARRNVGRLLARSKSSNFDQ